MSSHADLPDYRTLLIEVEDGVATVTLNRPRQRNALGDGMREELADAYRRLDRRRPGPRHRAHRHAAGLLRRRRPRVW